MWEADEPYRPTRCPWQKYHVTLQRRPVISGKEFHPALQLPAAASQRLPVAVLERLPVAALQCLPISAFLAASADNLVEDV